MHRRLLHIDLAKVVASNLIVLHHLAVYGPLSDTLHQEVPLLAAWLFDYARMAVQVFLVIGGYFAASSLAAHGFHDRLVPWRPITQRFVRLVLPLGTALALTMAASAVTRLWLQADFVPEQPNVLQLLAHGTLTYDVLGVEPLSIGIWYVAIDFQLFALMALMLWVAGRRAGAIIALAGIASLFYFNRHPQYDVWAVYFLGAYALGAFAWWSGHSQAGAKMLSAMAAVGLAALVWDFRGRIAVALLTALWLGTSRWRMRTQEETPLRFPALVRAIRSGARSSYALFLIHFAVLMLGNAVWANADTTSGLHWLIVLAGTWLISILLAILFERFIERPLGRINLGRQATPIR